MATSFVMTCSFCREQILVQEDWIGQKIQCPSASCGRTLTVEAPQLPATQALLMSAPSGKAPSADPATAGAAIRTPIVRMIDWMIGGLRFQRLSPIGFGRYQTILSLIGAYAILAAGGVFLLHQMVLAIQAKAPALLLLGLGGVLGAGVLHYVAVKFAGSVRSLFPREPRPVPCPAFMECLGMLAVLGMVGFLAEGVTAAIASKRFALIPIALFRSFLSAHLALFCFNVEACLGIRRESMPTDAGGVALAILEFLFRCVLGLASIALGAGASLGTVWLFVASIQTWAGNMQAISAMPAALRMVISAALAPMSAHLFFALVMLSVALCAAIFEIAANTRPSRDQTL